MENLLVPIDGLQDSRRIIERVIEIYRLAPVEVHLLNVQSPFPGHIAMYFSGAQVRRFHLEDGMRELMPARRALEDAGIPFTCYVEVGNRAETIARFARERQCRQIVMNGAAKGFLSDMVLASLASQVRQLIRGSAALCEVI
jgi:nucleotide-binding universal stress UspA family protein